MVTTKQSTVYQCFIGCLLLIGLISRAYAVDSPDTPDLIGEFKQREMIYLTAIDNPKNSRRGFLIAYDNYLTFLDNELSLAFEVIKLKLPQARNLELMTSQLQWVKYRDAEFELIKNTWTSKDFGSSSGISRGDYRTSIVKDRIIQLLHYANNYYLRKS